MSDFFKFIGAVHSYKAYTAWGILFHFLAAFFTVLSIPLVVPFFQLLFGTTEISLNAPNSLWDLEGYLNYGYALLITNWDRIDALKLVCATVIIVFLLKNICRFLISYFMIPVRNGILRDLRKEIWSSFQSLSLSRRNELQQGYLNSLITNDLMEVDHGILKSFELLFKLPFIVLGSLLVMLLLNPMLTLIAFGLILFTLIVVGRVSHSLKLPSRASQSSLASISSLVDQYLSSMKLVRSLGLESYFSASFDKENEAYLTSTNTVLRKRDLASPLSEFFGVCTIVILLFVGTLMVLRDTMEPSSFFAFIFAFYNIIDPAKSFSREYSNVQRGLAALERINAFNHNGRAKNEVEDQNIRNTQVKFTQTLKLDKISLAYDSTEVLSDVSIEIVKGEKVGIVGFSGEGKTSILDAILRFYKIEQGAISIDNVNIQEFELQEYRSTFGLVAQEPMLFHGSVKENIVLDKSLDDSLLAMVMRISNLDYELLSQSVGDRGVRLSGGQRQRISIARALYKEPEVLLLDEPTSELDAENEREVIDAILNTLGEKTVILVSHNIHLLKNMDKIIVLSKGTVEAIGTFEQLLGSSSSFSRLLGKD